MNHSNNNFYDLSVNGLKINITDISSNNFFQNRNFSSLHTSNRRNLRSRNLLPPLEEYNKNKMNIKKETDDFNMSVNKLLEDIRKKRYYSTNRNTYEENRLVNHNKYKTFLNKTNDQIKETERNDENTVVYYNPNRNTKTEFDKLLERLDNNYHNQY